MGTRRCLGAYYHGDTYDGEREVWLAYDAKGLRELPARGDLLHVDFTGYSWGAYNLRVRQLAVALLADATGSDEYAVELHEAFARFVLKNLHQDAWILSADWVLKWVQEQLHKIGEALPSAN